MSATQTNPAELFALAVTDGYAKNQKPFILADTIVYLSDAEMVWQFMRDCGDRMFRVIYQCKDGTIRDMIGRQGVHNSEQDGEVQGIGAPMASEENLTLSFWTATHGRKVNTGAGKGYRTLRAAGILALRVDKTDFVTGAGLDVVN